MMMIIIISPLLIEIMPRDRSLRYSLPELDEAKIEVCHNFG